MKYILETEVLTYDRDEEDRQRDLGIKNPKIQAWFPFLVDLRSIVALKPPGEDGSDGVPNMNETVIYTAWDSFVIKTSFEKTKKLWLKIKEDNPPKEIGTHKSFT